MYSRQELKAIAMYYWHMRERAAESAFCMVRVADFSKCYNMLTIEEKRALFYACWLEDGTNVNYLLDWMVDYLNGNV